jgi:type IV secretory pathway component VirB8
MRHESYGRRTTDVAVCVASLTRCFADEALLSVAIRCIVTVRFCMEHSDSTDRAAISAPSESNSFNLLTEVQKYTQTVANLGTNSRAEVNFLLIVM